MDNEKYCNDLFESILDYRKIVLLIILIQNDKDLLHEIGFSERDINRLNIEFKHIFLGQHEKHLDHIKNEEKSVIENFSNM